MNRIDRDTYKLSTGRRIGIATDPMNPIDQYLRRTSHETLTDDQLLKLAESPARSLKECAAEFCPPPSSVPDCFVEIERKA